MIKIKDLTKKFGAIKAVDGLNISIKKGEIFGLLGPNGAGKTTTVRMLNTLTRPTSGYVEIAGFNVLKSSLEVKKLIGVAPQEMNLDRDLTGRQNLHIHGLLHKVSSTRREEVDLLKWAGVADRADTIISKYSGGMQRRLIIARSIMHNPHILFLDEPTVGLDPQIRRTIWDMVRDLNENSEMTVLLTTHYIEEAEKLCNRVGILSKGKLIACSTPSELKSRIGKFVVETQDNGSTDYQLFETRDEANRFAETMTNMVNIRESNLEDVFIHLTGKKI